MTTPAPKNGCFNRAPFRAIYVAQDGYYPMVRDGLGRPTLVQRHVDVPFRMSPECQYTNSDLGQADQRCVGCRWRADGAPKVDDQIITPVALRSTPAKGW